MTEASTNILTRLKYQLPLLLLSLFAIFQFFLILRHKSTFLSDSYFYKHIFYEIKGDTFNTARSKILSEIDILKADEVSKNLYLNESAYKNSLSFFTKRPLYPFTASLISYVISSTYVAFLIPVFISYLGSIFLSSYFFRKSLNYSFSIIATALLVAFYPFLDWSTYIITDTIGFFFWLSQLFFIYKYLTRGQKQYFYFFLISLPMSFFLREQSTLMLPLLIIAFLHTSLNKSLKSYSKPICSLLIPTLLIVLIYLLIQKLTNQKNLIDTITYTMNNYGLYSSTFSTKEIIAFHIKAVLRAHSGFMQDLIRHHWWFLFSTISIPGVFSVFVTKKKQSIISALVLYSALSSYLAIFLYPVLSYRYFFPVLIAIILFSVKFFEDYPIFLKRA